MNESPQPNERVFVAKLGDTVGMLIQPQHLSNRTEGVIGTCTGWVPGHGGDVVWVQHDGDPNLPVQAYSYTELERAFYYILNRVTDKLLPGPAIFEDCDCKFGTPDEAEAHRAQITNPEEWRVIDSPTRLRWYVLKAYKAATYIRSKGVFLRRDTKSGKWDIKRNGVIRAGTAEQVIELAESLGWNKPTA